MTVLLYFAWVRERIGAGQERLDIPAHVETPLALAQWLATRGGGYADAFAEPTRLKCAVDQQMVTMDAPLASPKEIAFFPPVTGG